MNPTSILRLALLAAMVPLSWVLIVLTDASPTSADVAWPTPEPGPQPQVPKVIGDADVQKVDVPPKPGASWVILPLAMLVPRFPPVPSFPVQSADGVRIISDAGSIITTVQVVYEPISPTSKVPQPGPLQELRKVFDLRAFDHRGDPTVLDLRRPWVLEVPIRGLRETFEDPARFLIARYEDSRGWVPLVTSYHRDRGILQALVLKVGRFAVIAEPPVISG